MRWIVFLCWFLVAACGNPPTEQPIASAPAPAPVNDSPVVQESSVDTNVSFAKDTLAVPRFTPVVKKPSGIYQFIYPYNGQDKILHTIAFDGNTFRLQEEYFGKKDSIVITEGTWAPSQGYIWLYKDQLARGRYTWKGDTLQYYSPRLKRAFSLAKLTPATANKVWMDKKAQGAVLFAVGTEPFWSVEISNQDSIILNMPHWTAPLRVSISGVKMVEKGTIYTGISDSLSVKVLPYFCSDGMSDFIYSNKVTVSHRGKIYSGCGIAF